MTFRKGDRVSVLATVTHDQDEDKRVFVRVEGEHSDSWIEAKDLVMVQPTFEEGDTVTFGGTMEPLSGGTILSIQQGHAWIDLGGGNYCTRVLTSIQRVDPEETTS